MGSGQGAKKFLSTPSARRATWLSSLSARRWRISIHALCEEGDAADPLCGLPLLYFYPRPLRGGRRCDRCLEAADAWISIHALCEEGDRTDRAVQPDQRDFYPRPLRGGRHCIFHIPVTLHAFLSTPSARRATVNALESMLGPNDFYPRPLRGGRLLAGHRASSPYYFYPRPLRGGRRVHGQLDVLPPFISIHALCEEGDCRRCLAEVTY